MGSLTQVLHLPEGDDDQTILNTATLITLAITLTTIRLSIRRHPHHDSDYLTTPGPQAPKSGMPLSTNCAVFIGPESDH